MPLATGRGPRFARLPAVGALRTSNIENIENISIFENSIFNFLNAGNNVNKPFFGARGPSRISGNVFLAIFIFDFCVKHTVNHQQLLILLIVELWVYFS